MNTKAPRLALEVQDAWVHYGNVCAVEAVNLQIEPGTIHVLLGRSGSGKTTLLRSIAGFEPLRRGAIFIDGKQVDAATKSSWVPPESRKIGFVFQDYALFPHLSVLDNIAFGVLGSKSEKQLIAQKWASRVGLQELGTRKPDALSGGEQQRVAVARVLAQGTHVLLFDEPFSNLDAHLRRRVRDETINLIRENNATAIFVTHDFEEAFAIADFVSVLHDAKLEQTGTPAQIYNTPASIHVARLCGQATFLKVHKVLGENRALSALGEVNTTGTLREDSLLVVRPECLSATKSDDSQHSGTLLKRRYLGSTEELEVELAGNERVLIRQAPGLLEPNAKTVRIESHHTYAAVLPAPGHGQTRFA